jgi:hypothetical protein
MVTAVAHRQAAHGPVHQDSRYVTSIARRRAELARLLRDLLAGFGRPGCVNR